MLLFTVLRARCIPVLHYGDCVYQGIYVFIQEVNHFKTTQEWILLIYKKNSHDSICIPLNILWPTMMNGVECVSDLMGYVNRSVTAGMVIYVKTPD